MAECAKERPRTVSFCGLAFFLVVLLLFLICMEMWAAICKKIITQSTQTILRLVYRTSRQGYVFTA